MSIGDELPAIQATADAVSVAGQCSLPACRTRAEPAAAVGLSPARISRVLNLLKLPADIQERLRKDLGLTEQRVRGWATNVKHECT